MRAAKGKVYRGVNGPLQVRKFFLDYYRGNFLVRHVLQSHF